MIHETPLHHAVNLSNRLECKVLLKREDLLPVFSFKLRGAYNKMAHLSQEQRWKGVVACSAGKVTSLSPKFWIYMGDILLIYILFQVTMPKVLLSLREN